MFCICVIFIPHVHVLLFPYSLLCIFYIVHFDIVQILRCTSMYSKLYIIQCSGPWRPGSRRRLSSSGLLGKPERGVGNLEWGGDGAGMRKGRSVYEQPGTKVDRVASHQRRVSK